MDERAMLVLLVAIVTSLNAVADGKSMTTPDIEYVLVKQHTAVGRVKRDTGGYDVDFPAQMSFTIGFRNKEYSLDMLRNIHMTSNPAIFTKDGQRPNSTRKIGIYQDADNFAAMLVNCEESAELCTLQGSMMIDDSIWKISRDENTATTNMHRARRSADVTEEALFKRTDGVSADKHKRSVSDKIVEDIQKKYEEKMSSRSKRSIPDCEIVEVYAFIDWKEWKFWKKLHGFDIVAAENAAREYYMGLYNEVDLRFSMIPMIKTELCIRIFFTGLYIPTDIYDDWTAGAETECLGNTLGVYDPTCIDGLKALEGCAYIQEFKRPYLWDFDHAQCFTGHDIIYNGDDSHTSLAYLGTLCVTPWFPWYQVSIVESSNEWVDLAAARAIGHALGSRHDGSIGCDDDDYFIMSVNHESPTTLALKYNRWMFSNCSLDMMWWHIMDDGTMDERAMLVLLVAIVTALNAVADGKSMTTPDIEYVLVKQNTAVGRVKRDTGGYDVAFPAQMSFTIGFRNKEYSLDMLRNIHMTSNPAIFTKDGQRPNSTQGSMMIDDSIWKISRDENTATTNMHRARRSADVTEEALFKRTDGVSADKHKRSVSDKIVEDIQKKYEEKMSSRSKRSIPDCEIVEVYAFIDWKEWKFWKKLHGFDIVAAENAAREYYMGLYNEVDLRFSMIPMIKTELCIRIFFTGLYIPTDIYDDWTAGAETECLGNTLGVYDPTCIDGLKALEGCAYIQEFKRPYLWDFDHAQCFTGHDIIYNGDDSHTSLAYLGTLCVTPWFPWYQVSIVESSNEWVDLAAARAIGHALGSRHDGSIGCDDDDYFIMSVNHESPTTLALKYNRWMFSNCSLDMMWWHIMENPPCLRDHHFDMDDWWNQVEKPDLGTVYTQDEQCKFRYGKSSNACGLTYPANMCVMGISCTIYDVCSGTVGVFTGTQCDASGQVCFKGNCVPDVPRSPKSSSSSPESSSPESSPSSVYYPPPPRQPIPSSSSYRPPPPRQPIPSSSSFNPPPPRGPIPSSSFNPPPPRGPIPSSSFNPPPPRGPIPSSSFNPPPPRGPIPSFSPCPPLPPPPPCPPCPPCPTV